MVNLSGSTAIISGGLGDIARTTALALARAGANVALGDLYDPEDATDFLKDLEAAGVRGRYDRVDVSDSAQVRDWIMHIEQDLGPADLVIANAAMVTIESIRAIAPESWEKELAVNLNGAFYLAQAAAQRLLARKLPGRIVFISSWAAEKAHPDIPAYCVSKAGLRMLSKCMALNFAADRILVNELALGFVDGGFSRKAFKEHPGLEERLVSWVPTRSLIELEQVAREVLHLCDPARSHMTGAVVLVDGGLSLTNISHGTREY